MHYPPDFLHELKDRAANRCECERVECHQAQGRCREMLSGEPDPLRWTPVMTGERITFPPVVSNYIALCGTCAVPRNRTKPGPGSA